jgi:Flp pilus assembly protein TadG
MTDDSCRVPCRADRGAASTELVLVSPVLIVFLFLVVLAGRLTDARSDVVSAASDAARAASIQGSEGAAHAAAADIATRTLAGEGIECAGGAGVSVDYLPAFGRGATVHVVVTCNVPVSDLALLDLGRGVITVTQHAYEVIDTHRSL